MLQSFTILLNQNLGDQAEAKRADDRLKLHFNWRLRARHG